MSDPYQEAFQDVLKAERKRKTVWILTYHAAPPAYICKWRVLQGILGEDLGSAVSVQIGDPGNKPWIIFKTNVFSTRKKANKAEKGMNKLNMGEIDVVYAVQRE